MYRAHHRSPRSPHRIMSHRRMTHATSRFPAHAQIGKVEPETTRAVGAGRPPRGRASPNARNAPSVGGGAARCRARRVRSAPSCRNARQTARCSNASLITLRIKPAPMTDSHRLSAAREHAPHTACCMESPSDFLPHAAPVLRIRGASPSDSHPPRVPCASARPVRRCLAPTACGRTPRGALSRPRHSLRSSLLCLRSVA